MNEVKRNKIQQLLLLVLALLAILLLAGGVGELRFKPAEEFNLFGWLLAQLEGRGPLMDPDVGPSDEWTGFSSGVQTIVVVLFWLILGFSILYAIISPQFRRELVRVFVMVLPLVLFFPYIARKIAQQEQKALEMEGQMGELAFGGEPLPAAPTFIQDPPAWFLTLVKGLLLAFVLLGIYALWRAFRPKPDRQAVVIRHVKRALSELESGGAFKDVVIACYAQMCRELSVTQGIERAQAMTPREFEEHLAAAGIASDHIRLLTLLFEGVRYGDKPSDQATEKQAVQSLQAILDAYGA
jgi:hypothetical protein